MPLTHQKTGARELRETRQRDVYAYRLRGLTIRQIADQLDVPYSTVGRDLTTVMAAVRKETVDAAGSVRDLEVARLDMMLSALWPKALKGETLVIDRVLRIMERRAALLGLDAPVKTDLTSAGHEMSALTLDGLSDADRMSIITMAYKRYSATVSSVNA